MQGERRLRMSPLTTGTGAQTSSWRRVTFSPMPAGVVAFTLPAGQTAPHPLGITVSDGRALFTDYGRSVLGRMPAVKPLRMREYVALALR